MSDVAKHAEPTPHRRARTRRLLALLATVALAPVVLSYLAYYVWPRESRVNYGELLNAGTIAPIEGTKLDGTRFDVADLRGRWIILYTSEGSCSDTCASALYAGRQARTIQNAERERVTRVWLVTDTPLPSAELVAAQADLVVARVEPRAAASLPRGTDRLYLIDPLGNFVLAWPSKPDIKAMAKDLTRLLRASSIG